MRLSIDVALEGTLADGDAALLMIEVLAADGQTVVVSKLDAGQASAKRLEQSGMLWVVPTATNITLHHSARVEITRATIELSSLEETPLCDLSGEVLPYLRPSRFCQSDLFTDFSLGQFGDLKGGTKVQAIRDWIADNLTYVSGSSHEGTTTAETFASLTGVCRDYAYLFCALAPAAQIPARYASVYGTEVTPLDFHAVAQVWVGDAWHMVDATGMGAPPKLAVTTMGRDAVDCAIMETVGLMQIDHQAVRVTKV